MKTFSNISKKVAICLSGVFLLVSCNMPYIGSSTGSSVVWLDQPTIASLLPLAPFTLKAHARGDVTRIEFLVNDVPVGSVNTDSSQPIVYGETSSNPSVPGSYTISAKAFAENGFTLSEIANVCVSGTVSAASASFSGECASPIAGAGPLCL